MENEVKLITDDWFKRFNEEQGKPAGAAVDVCKLLDWLARQQLLNKHDVSGRSDQLGFDEGYAKGYDDATREAISEIHKNYRPNCL